MEVALSYELATPEEKGSLTALLKAIRITRKPLRMESLVLRTGDTRGKTGH